MEAPGGGGGGGSPPAVAGEDEACEDGRHVSRSRSDRRQLPPCDGVVLGGQHDGRDPRRLGVSLQDVGRPPSESPRSFTSHSSSRSSRSSSSSASRSRSSEDGESGGQKGREEVVHFAWKRGMLLDSRYELTKLLGDGTFGRVVLAHDRQEDRYVAVKIIRDVKKYCDNARIEADILKDIKRADPQEVGKCSTMYEAFLHESRFFCLVFEPLGTSLYSILKRNAYRGFWLQDIQSFASQCLSALAFLHHKLRLTHTDLKPENILLQSTEAARPSHFPRETFWQETHGASPRTPYARPADSRVKLIDFGNATYEQEHHSSTINTRQYRSPEVLLESGWDELSDLWSLGCILMELYTGDLLFNTHETLEHLALMERTLRPLPASVLGVASASAKKSYVAQDSCSGLPLQGSAEHEDARQSTWRLRWPEGASSVTSERHVHDQRPLAALVLRHHQLLTAFVEWLLALERPERPSAMEALKHPFLSAPFND